MYWFSNLRIKTKLLFCFILAAVFTVVVGIMGIINMYGADNIGLIERINASNGNRFRFNTTVMIATIAIAVVLTIFIGIAAASYVSRRISQLSSAVKNINIGNISVEMNVACKDEIGDLSREIETIVNSTRQQMLNAYIESFNKMLGDINISAEQLAVGAALVSGASQYLSQGSIEQASAVEQITSSITEIAAQTKVNAASAKRAGELAEVSKADVDSGKYQMLEMLNAMNEIYESSANISRIMKIIEDIAFQINIVALNATVEAARAGQHGKGFAVAAEKARNLAARSAEAVKETVEIIEESIKKFDQGRIIAKDTAEALNIILENINDITNIVLEISVSSNEQAQGILQINDAIEQVSKVTQINSASSEVTASASEDLSNQAVLLKEMLGKFDLNPNEIIEDAEEDISILYPFSKQEKYKAAKVSYKEEEAINHGKVKISLDENDLGKYTL
ncbi:MAG: methyl-accepting chemotaxis protein [Bacillota bacterium]|nr:methyl-accepting chemotaxis protein [Bacillota bacterium]